MKIIQVNLLLILIFLFIFIIFNHASFPAQVEISRFYWNPEQDNNNNLYMGKYVNAFDGYYSKLHTDADSAQFRQKKIKVSEVYNHIALSYMKQKKYNYALRYLNMARGIKHDILGAQSAPVGFIYNNIGSVYVDRNQASINDIKSAIEYYTKALAIFLKSSVSSEQRQITRNLTLANTYHNLGNAYRKNKQYSESIYNFGRAIYLQNNTVGIGFYSHLQSETYYYLGMTYDEQALYTKGLENYVKAATIDVVIGGLDTYKFDKQVHGHQLYRKNQIRYKEARDYLFTQLNNKLSSSSSISNGLSTGVTYMLLGGVYEESENGNYTEALSYYQAASEIFSSHLTSGHHLGEMHHFDSTHILLMDIYNKMGLSKQRQEKFNDAKTYFRYAVNMTLGLHHSDLESNWNRSAASRAHVLGQRYTGKDAYDTESKKLWAANIYSNQAKILTIENDYTSAKGLLLEAISIREGWLSSKIHSSVGHNKFNYGLTLLQQNSDTCTSEIKSYFTAARNIYIDVLGSRHSATKEVMNYITNKCNGIA